MNARSIILVDDNSTLVTVYQDLLCEHGFPTTSACSGEEAVALCENTAHPPLAIVDLKMPGMDGPEIIAALKDRQPQIKVIAMSGQGLQPYFGRLADLGVRFFLPKPFTIEALIVNIRELEAA